MRRFILAVVATSVAAVGALAGVAGAGVAPAVAPSASTPIARASTSAAAIPTSLIATTALPDVIVVTIGVVSVSATNPAGKPWDLAPEPREGLCELASFATGLASNNPIVGKGAETFCNMLTKDEHKKPDVATNPDLVVRVRAGSMEPYRTYVARDELVHEFTYKFVVPTAAIATEKLCIVVQNDNGRAAPDTIAANCMDRADVERAWSSPSHSTKFGKKGESLEGLDVSFSSYASTSLSGFQVPVSSGAMRARIRPLMAGEVVAVRARGRYSVVSQCEQGFVTVPCKVAIDPTGIPGGGDRSTNFGAVPFRDWAHGIGIAVAGSGGLATGNAIGPCATWPLEAAGEISVGIDDAEPSGDEGSITFDIATRAPASVEEWQGRWSASKLCPP